MVINPVITRTSVQNNIDNLSIISDFINDVAVKYGLDESKIFDIKIAVDEACTNIIQYAYPDGQEGMIDIACYMKDNAFFVEIRDYGQPFDPIRTNDPELSDSLDERDLGGLGIYFIKQLIDEIKYEYRENDGYETLTMIKYIQD